MIEMSFLSDVDVGESLGPVIEFMGYLIFTFIGSLFKEIYNTNNKDDYEFRAHQVISSTIAASFTCVFARSMYLSEYGYGVMAFISFTLGLLGFEIFKNLSSVKGIKKLLDAIKKGDPTDILEEDDDAHNALKITKDKPRNKPSPQLTPTIKIHVPRKKNKDDEE
jgi:hypothetical protein